MSTRATYRFKGRGRWGVTTTIYVHYDGYPDGAAIYFYATLCNPSKGSFATQFIRAVEHAEITHSHDCHGDTEYKYDIDDTVLQNGAEQVACYKRDWSDDDQWRLVAADTVAGFIDRHHAMIKDYSPFRTVKLAYDQNVVMNARTAPRHLHHPMSHLIPWSQSGVVKRGAANWDGLEQDARAILAEFPELWTDEIRAVLDGQPVPAVA